MPDPAGYTEEEVMVDGVRAIRRRRVSSARKLPYLYLPMACVTALAQAKLPATAWPLALAVLQHLIVSGGAADITAAFATRFGIEGRDARRYATNALAASGLFQVQRNGTRALQARPGPLLTMLLTANSRRA